METAQTAPTLHANSRKFNLQPWETRPPTSGRVESQIESGARGAMNSNTEVSFHVRPEVAALYDVSCILCGMFFCEQCQAAPPIVSGEVLYSDRYYYRIAELAFDVGWRALSPAEHSALCQNCVAEKSMHADST